MLHKTLTCSVNSKHSRDIYHSW